MRRFLLKDGQLTEGTEADDYDVEFDSTDSMLAVNADLIPLESSVQAARVFYGSRFFGQAVPVEKPEAPLVQNLSASDPDGRSFDQIYGRKLGAVFADEDSEIEDVQPDFIKLRTPKGSKKINLYNGFVFNRKTGITQKPLVQPGDRVAAGQLLARSNYTDDKGTAALGVNARIGLVPYKGYTMDDAIVISESFARRLASEHMDQHAVEWKKGVQGGKDHFVSLYPGVYTTETLGNLDDDGVVKVGTVVQPGDPLVLATRPKMVSSSTATAGKLSRAMRQARTDATLTWDAAVPGEVIRTLNTDKGAKVVVRSIRPTSKGDKIVLRSGQKSIVSKIIPDDEMPRTEDGEPLEVLLNQLGIPSRVNNSLPYELALGKVAKKTGQPLKLPSFTAPGVSWRNVVRQALQEAQVPEKERVYDPKLGRYLARPITVGNAYMLKLHHISESKLSGRGQSAYDADQQPLKGGGESAQAKRFSGLEIAAALSSGATASLREQSTLRGQQNEEFWRQLREGNNPPPPGTPFVWHKFRALLAGAGINTRDFPDGRIRLGPLTDKALEQYKPLRLENGEIVDATTLDPVPGGLFDPAVVSGNKWAQIDLPRPLPNPAYEDAIRTLLGLTKKQFADVMAGKASLDEFR